MATETTSAPPMTFNAGDLLDADRMQNGPLVFFWGQDEYVAPNKPIENERPDAPRRSLRGWLFRVQPWSIDIRIVPPADANLEEWGREIATALGITWTGKPEDGDKAVWLPGLTWAKNGGQALASAKFIFDKLAAFRLGAAQVRVERLA